MQKFWDVMLLLACGEAFFMVNYCGIKAWFDEKLRDRQREAYLNHLASIKQEELEEGYTANADSARACVQRSEPISEVSSGNVFADIGMPNPERALAAAELARKLMSGNHKLSLRIEGIALSYDASVDVLYLTFAEDVKPQRYTETESGDIIRFDNNTSALVGCTIPFFLKRLLGTA